MTTYPLPTLACTISSTGITSPSYADIYASLQASFQGIFGSDSYLNPDSADGQMLAIYAQAQYDSNQATIAAYNSFSPTYAQGVGLSSVVKINGLTRETASPSTAQVVVTGTVGLTFNGIVIGDDQSLGTFWNLPSPFTIGGGGTVTVEATCTVAGATLAEANTLTDIITPTLGLDSVTNPSPAIPGAPIEDDATLRQRQAISTSIPALSVLDAIVAEVANLPGVTRIRAYENDTGVPDDNGIPGHTISLVVAGGNTQQIGNTISQTKTPGTGTYGTTTIDTLDEKGVPNEINFYELTEVPLTIGITIQMLRGYSSTTAALIKSSVAQFLNDLEIGEYSYLGRLYSPANLSGDAATTATGLSQAQLDALAATYTVLSITQSRSAPPGVTNVTGGPYLTGTTMIPVASVEEIFPGSVISMQLNDLSLFTATVLGISTLTLNLSAGVPAGHSVLNGSIVYLVSDAQIQFFEAAQGITTDITITAV